MQKDITFSACEKRLLQCVKAERKNARVRSVTERKRSFWRRDYLGRGARVLTFLFVVVETSPLQREKCGEQEGRLPRKLCFTFYVIKEARKVL
jgi:hypothetical protein